MDCQPKALATAAKCWCFPADRQRAVRIFLLCSWANAAPTPPPQFSYAPATSIITWTDVHGPGQNGNLAFFNATADFASVTKVELYSQHLTAISNLVALPALTYLDLWTNSLTTLDVTQNSALTFLDCSYNSLTALDVHLNTALTGLGCGGNALTVVDVTQNTALINFGCSINSLTALDVTQNTALTGLGCSNNSLTTLDLTHNPALVNLYCYSNALTALDISYNTLLTHLYCYSNQLTVLAVNTILANLVTFGHTGGTVNTSSQTPAAPPSAGPPDGLLAKAALLAETPAWTVTTDVGTLVYAPSSSIITWTDVHGPGQNGNLAFFNAHADFATVTAIDIKTQGITAISHVGDLPGLIGFIAFGNSIAALDLTHNPLLTQINVSNNSLGSLDVTHNTLLIQLYCSSNVLISLNVLSNPALTILYAHLNPLTTVDLSGNPLLTQVFLYQCTLTVLAVNTILCALVAAGQTGGTVYTFLQTPAAPPSTGPPDGIAAKAALLAETPAWTIATD